MNLMGSYPCHSVAEGLGANYEPGLRALPWVTSIPLACGKRSTALRKCGLDMIGHVYSLSKGLENVLFVYLSSCMVLVHVFILFCFCSPEVVF